MSHQDDIRQQIAAYNRRLQLLKQQQTKMGISVDPKIVIEIEDIEAEIEKLQAELNEQEDITQMASQPKSNDTSIRPQKARSVKNTIWGLPQVWWVPIVVALIGLIAVIIPLVINNKASTSPSFTYAVRVQKEGTSQNIPNAKVTIEVAGQAPLDEITDANGFARIAINASYAGKPGRLLVEANGYEAYRQEIDLTEGNLPDTIPLKELP